MIFQEEVIMAINGILVTNISQSEPRFRAQAEDFLEKAKKIAFLSLNEVANQDVLDYITSHKVDFVLFYDKDIYLARHLEKQGIRIFNKSKTIELSDDKAMTALELKSKGVAQPPFFVFPLHFWGNIYEYYEKYRVNLCALGFPLVLKERQGSFGDQVYLAHNEDELKTLIREHGTKALIAQAYLAKHSGTDYRVNVVGGKVVLTVKRSNDHDFRSNINQGGTVVVVLENKAISRVALAAAKALKADFAGVDVMLDDTDNPVVLEVNSNMRTVSVNKLSEVDVTHAILEHIVKEVVSVRM